MAIISLSVTTPPRRWAIYGLLGSGKSSFLKALKKSVLVIDDDADVRDLLSRMLVEAGWKAVTAKDGKDGLEKIKEQPSLIVLDLEMPRMDGLEFLEAYMMDYPAEERAPVLVYSGKDLTEVQRDFLDKNVAGMVRKDDVSMDELSTIVKNIYQESTT